MAQSIWAAAQEYDVTLISFVQEEPSPAPEAFKRLGIHVKTVPHRPSSTPVALARGLFGRLPYTLARYRSPAFARVVEECVRTLRPAFAMANHLHTASYVDRLNGVPLVLREHNLEHLWMSRYAEESLKGPARAYAGYQARRLEAAERSFCQAAALTLAIQDLERDALRALAPGAWVETLPVGIDLGRFGEPRPVDPPVVLLAGSFAWPPTATGAIRFLKDGWPRVREAVPDARLRVVGKSQPDDFLQAARDAGADVVPMAPSMAEEMARASVMVVPLWSGAGARVKIMEALAARLPVVSTPIGAEGLGLMPGTHYVEAPDARELGVVAGGLLQEAAQRASLAREGRAYAETHWSHVEVARLQNELVARIAR